ncbi:hypothetical protein AZ044_004450, partial [Pluralibacter gergoviae]
AGRRWSGWGRCARSPSTKPAP